MARQTQTVPNVPLHRLLFGVLGIILFWVVFVTVAHKWVGSI